MHTITFSIITVCKDESPERIQKTFDSIRFQTYRNYEHVVVDGGSCNMAVIRMAECASQLSVYIAEQDQGIYHAMNKGVAAATGEFLVFMNVGDTFSNNHVLNIAHNYIGKYPSHDVYYGDIYTSNGVYKTLPHHISRRTFFFRTICHQATFSRACAVKTLGGFDLSYKLIADRDLLLRMLVAGSTFAHIGSTVCVYELNGKSSDVCTGRNERRRFHRQYYSVHERAMLFMCKIGLSAILRANKIAKYFKRKCR